MPRYKFKLNNDNLAISFIETEDNDQYSLEMTEEDAKKINDHLESELLKAKSKDKKIETDIKLLFEGLKNFSEKIENKDFYKINSPEGAFFNEKISEEKLENYEEFLEEQRKLEKSLPNQIIKLLSNIFSQLKEKNSGELENKLILIQNTIDTYIEIINKINQNITEFEDYIEEGKELFIENLLKSKNLDLEKLKNIKELFNNKEKLKNLKTFIVLIGYLYSDRYEQMIFLLNENKYSFDIIYFFNNYFQYFKYFSYFKKEYSEFFPDFQKFEKKIFKILTILTKKEITEKNIEDNIDVYIQIFDKINKNIPKTGEFNKKAKILMVEYIFSKIKISKENLELIQNTIDTYIEIINKINQNNKIDQNVSISDYRNIEEGKVLFIENLLKSENLDLEKLKNIKELFNDEEKLKNLKTFIVLIGYLYSDRYKQMIFLLNENKHDDPDTIFFLNNYFQYFEYFPYFKKEYSEFFPNFQDFEEKFFKVFDMFFGKNIKKEDIFNPKINQELRKYNIEELNKIKEFIEFLNSDDYNELIISLKNNQIDIEKFELILSKYFYYLDRELFFKFSLLFPDVFQKFIEPLKIITEIEITKENIDSLEVKDKIKNFIENFIFKKTQYNQIEGLYEHISEIYYRLINNYHLISSENYQVPKINTDEKLDNNCIVLNSDYSESFLSKIKTKEELFKEIGLTKEYFGKKGQFIYIPIDTKNHISLIVIDLSLSYEDAINPDIHSCYPLNVGINDSTFPSLKNEIDLIIQGDKKQDGNCWFIVFNLVKKFKELKNIQDLLEDSNEFNDILNELEEINKKLSEITEDSEEKSKLLDKKAELLDKRHKILINNLKKLTLDIALNIAETTKNVDIEEALEKTPFSRELLFEDGMIDKLIKRIGEYKTLILLTKAYSQLEENLKYYDELLKLYKNLEKMEFFDKKPLTREEFFEILKNKKTESNSETIPLLDEKISKYKTALRELREKVEKLEKFKNKLELHSLKQEIREIYDYFEKNKVSNRVIFQAFGSDISDEKLKILLKNKEKIAKLFYASRKNLEDNNIEFNDEIIRAIGEISLKFDFENNNIDILEKNIKKVIFELESFKKEQENKILKTKNQDYYIITKILLKNIDSKDELTNEYINNTLKDVYKEILEKDLKENYPINKLVNTIKDDKILKEESKKTHLEKLLKEREENSLDSKTVAKL